MDRASEPAHQNPNPRIAYAERRVKPLARSTDTVDSTHEPCHYDVDTEPTPPRRREGLTVPKYLRLLPRFFQSLRCPLVGQAGLARRRRVQPLSGEEFSYGQDLDAGMLAPR